ncbi:MAG: aminoacyl-tRNA hydrolase, partial [Microgenomates group bacterium]
MKLIVGLGNPGEKYENSRHNLGFMVVEALARKFLPLKGIKWEKEEESNSLILRVPPNILLVKPQTFMNASGYAVDYLIANYQIANL